MTEKITVDEAVRLLEEVVKEFGEDYVYPQRTFPGPYENLCEYVRDNQPSCIVAQVAYRAGIPLTEIERWDTASQFGKGLAAEKALVNYATPDARQILQIAQNAQDIGISWGGALQKVYRRLDTSSLMM